MNFIVICDTASNVAGCGTRTALQSTTRSLRLSEPTNINSSLTDTCSYIFVVEGSLSTLR